MNGAETKEQPRKVTRVELMGLYVSQLGLVSRLQEAIVVMVRDPLAQVRWDEKGVNRVLSIGEARQRYKAEAQRALEMFDQLWASGLKAATQKGPPQ